MATATIDDVQVDVSLPEVDFAPPCEVQESAHGIEPWEDCEEVATHEIVFTTSRDTVLRKFACGNCLLEIWSLGRMLSATKLGG
ncbi:hypothetical protein L3Y21_gp076 [Gordonia phage Rabbitrun]|uniref:Uncharacterized protein n=1 Tax=Gordonia phage Rabbitrun TaxID=2762280 RepID=A0A7G8LIP5_9CAUD|nr:hypothetical protein L3Y21_gp076 [Gordonia phage Rabbitrun]QNJ57117.1 hypothetical protein SEA_RABBITRUN_76 [Gordonia phage Rabbitrun]